MTYHQRELEYRLKFYDFTPEQVIAELDMLHSGEITQCRFALPLYVWYAAKEVIWERDGLHQKPQ